MYQVLVDCFGVSRGYQLCIKYWLIVSVAQEDICHMYIKYWLIVLVAKGDICHIYIEHWEIVSVALEDICYISSIV